MYYKVYQIEQSYGKHSARSLTFVQQLGLDEVTCRGLFQSQLFCDSVLSWETALGKLCLMKKGSCGISMDICSDQDCFFFYMHYLVMKVAKHYACSVVKYGVNSQLLVRGSMALLRHELLAFFSCLKLDCLDSCLSVFFFLVLFVRFRCGSCCRCGCC